MLTLGVIAALPTYGGNVRGKKEDLHDRLQGGTLVTQL